MTFTRHAEKRSQQRGISDLYTSLLYLYGNEKVINGSRHLTFDNHQKKKLRQEINKLKENLDKDIYMVLDLKDETVLTVAHKK